MSALDFFRFANLREHIRIAKETGAPQFMWTQDPILQKFRFCNVFREDDKTTRFFRDTVRDPLRDSDSVLLATIAWRWFNRIETCQLVPLEVWRRFDLDALEEILRPVQNSTQALVTGAYMVKTPLRVDKLTGILACLRHAKTLERGMIQTARVGCWLEGVHNALMEVPYLGRFMAYEIVTDLRHTTLLDRATDIMTWASAGPGALRGLEWVLDEKSPTYGTARAQDWALDRMRWLLAISDGQWDWPKRPWEMREVEHTLCEYDKYRRGQSGERLKRNYPCEQS